MTTTVDQETGEILTERDFARATLEEPFEAHAIKRRSGGNGKVFDYVSTDTVIRRLNKATKNNWSFAVKETTFLPGGTNRNGNDEQVMMVLGTLTVPGFGSRDGYGIQRLPSPLSNSDDLLKAAAGDALKRAAVSFNVAIDLYGPDLESPDGPSASPAPARAPQTRPQPQSPQPTRPAAPSAPQRGIGTNAQAVQRGIEREQAAGDPRLPEKYPRVEGKWDIPSVVQWMQDAQFVGVTDFGSAIKAAQAWGKQQFGIEDIVRHDSPPKPGKEQYGNGTYPSAVVEAVSYWMDQGEGVESLTAQAASALDEDDVPF